MSMFPMQPTTRQTAYSKWILLLSFMATCSLAAGQVPVQRFNYTIITQDNPSAICKLASAELGVFLEKSYAAPISLNGSDAPLTFFVGVSGQAILAGFSDLPDIKGKFGVFRKGRNLLFYGWDDQDIEPLKVTYGEAGTLLAVYYFLEKYAGTEFYIPGDAGYATTTNKPVVFDRELDIPKPTFILRGFSLQTKEYSPDEMVIFFRRSLCSIPRWGHYDIFYQYMKNWKKRFQKTHPEYFMLVDGKRVSERFPYHAPCLSNPDVIRQTAADIVEDLNKNPSKTTVKIFCDAPIALCECDTCKASEERKLTTGHIGGCEDVYGFLKKVADVVWQSHPGVNFLTQTKGLSYYRPPVLVNLGESFAVEVLTNQHSTNANMLYPAIADAKRWQAAGVKTFLKGYPRWGIPKTMPLINPKLTADYFRAFRGITAGACESELSFNPYSFSALNQYIFSKLLFDLDRDVDELIGRFCDFAYPGARDEMVQFYDELEKLYLQHRSVALDPYMNIYYADNLAKPMQLLEKAKGKCTKPFIYLDKLVDNFKVFYDNALKAKETVDPLRKLAADRANVTASVMPAYLKKPLEISTSPELWPDAVKCELQPPTMTTEPDFQKSAAYLACDKTSLYIGLIAEEADIANLKQTFSKIDEMDDSFEIMLMPDASTYFQILVNSKGNYRVLSRSKNGIVELFDLKLEFSTAKLSGERWGIAIKLPLSQFQQADFSRPWKFNIFRNRYSGSKRQSSGFRLFGADFHILDEYSTLVWPAASGTP
jgi:hypothetical protein